MASFWRIWVAIMGAFSGLKCAVRPAAALNMYVEKTLRASFVPEEHVLHRQPRERAGEHANAVRDFLRRGELVRPVAVAALRGHENHARRANERHEERVVIGATRHLPAGQLE